MTRRLLLAVARWRQRRADRRWDYIIARMRGWP
jgi:hypothetical protein